MKKPKNPWPEPRFFAFIAAAGLLESPILAAMGGKAPLFSPAGMWLCHLLSAAAAFLAPPREAGFFRATRHWDEALGVTALCVPGLGWLIGGLVALSFRQAPFAKEAYRFEDESDEGPAFWALLGTASGIRRDLEIGLDVIPAADALFAGDADLKRGAIQALGRLKSPESIRWIFSAQSDPSPETRFYATSTLTQLKRDFETAIRAAERAVFDHPSALDPQLAFQRARLDYARSGLLDPQARAALLSECRSWLERPAEAEPAALRLLYEVSRETDAGEALTLLGRLERASPDEAARWTRERAEILFELGRFGEVRALLRGRREELLRASAVSPDELAWRSAVLWWCDA